MLEHNISDERFEDFANLACQTNWKIIFGLISASIFKKWSNIGCFPVFFSSIDFLDKIHKGLLISSEIQIWLISLGVISSSPGALSTRTFSSFFFMSSSLNSMFVRLEMPISVSTRLDCAIPFGFSTVKTSYISHRSVWTSEAHGTIIRRSTWWWFLRRARCLVTCVFPLLHDMPGLVILVCIVTDSLMK